MATIALTPKAVATSKPVSQSALQAMLKPLKNRLFNRLLIVFVFNGIAASIPATLLLFFIDDVLKAPQIAAWSLVAYFAAGAAGMPLWVWLSARWGKARAWFIGMVVSIIAFVWAYTLGAGDTAAFLIICILSGLGLGADLALPPSILADVIDDDDKRGVGRNEGAYFGLWNLVTKMNLALAAGVALLPCLLKAVAAIALVYSPFFKSDTAAAKPVRVN